MSEPNQQRDEFVDFRNPNDPTLERLAQAVDRAYNHPGQVMWRGFLYGFMTALGGLFATFLIGFISVYVVSKFDLLNSVKESISGYTKDIVDNGVQSGIKSVDVGSVINNSSNGE